MHCFGSSFLFDEFFWETHSHQTLCRPIITLVRFGIIVIQVTDFRHTSMMSSIEYKNAPSSLKMNPVLPIWLKEWLSYLHRTRSFPLSDYWMEKFCCLSLIVIKSRFVFLILANERVHYFCSFFMMHSIRKYWINICSRTMPGST